MKYFKFISSVVFFASLSMSANASFFTTINGKQYEWLEVTDTRTLSLSRDDVQAKLNTDATLAGYEYASRALVEGLFLSYTDFGVEGYNGDAAIVSGVSDLISDLGFTTFYGGNGINSTFTTADGYEVNYDGYKFLNGLYGSSSECGGPTLTCSSQLQLYLDANGVASMAWQFAAQGWDMNSTSPDYKLSNNSYEGVGSYLVRPSVVPVPAAAWLFGTALLGFFGMSKRKANA